MGGAFDEMTFSGNADGGQDIVTRTHDLPNPCLGELINHACGAWLELVLEDDETNEDQTTLCFRSLHLLYLDPAQLRNMLRGTRNHSKASVCIISKQLLVIGRD